MKKILFLIIFAPVVLFSQSGAKWSTGLNGIGPTEAFGTSNNFPLLFYTNNSHKMTLATNGILQINNLIGSSNRLLQSDGNGNILPFNMGTSSQVLFGDGSWGALPSGASSWNTIGNHIFNSNAGFVGIGTNNPQFLLDINGNVRIKNNLYVEGQILITDKVESGVINTDTIRADTGSIVIGDTRVVNKFEVVGNSSFSGNLKLTSLVGVGDREVIVDSLGNLRTAPSSSTYGPCLPSSPTWHMGGDYISTLISTSVNDGSLGTCDVTDFVLKSNNAKKIWLKSNGKIGVGTSNPSEFFQIGDRFTFHDGGTKYIGYNSFFDGSTFQNKRIVADFASAIAMNGAQISLNLAANSSVGSTISFIPAIRMQLDPGNLGEPQVWIGNMKQISPGYANFRFAVDGIMVAREIVVTQQNWADYVFSKNYKLMPLLQVEKFILQNSHLPNIPSAKEIKDKG